MSKNFNVEDYIKDLAPELQEKARQCKNMDELMELALMEEEIPVDMLKKAIRTGVLAGELNPVFVGSAYKNKGIQELLDAVVDYLPSPLALASIEGTDPEVADYTESCSGSCSTCGGCG